MTEITVTLTMEHAKALDVFGLVEDSIGQVVDSLHSLAESDHIGWSEGGELRCHAETLKEGIGKLWAAYKVLYPLREKFEAETGE